MSNIDFFQHNLDDSSDFDGGTPELQRKRRALLNRESPYQDPALAESLLGLLYAHQIISKPLYEAGCFFGELGYRYQPCLGKFLSARSHVLSQKLEGKSPNTGCLTEEQEAKRAKKWHSAVESLKGAGQQPYRLVMGVVFYDQDLSEGVPMGLMRQEKSLHKGLRCLDVYFTKGLKGDSGMPHDPGLDRARSTRSLHLFVSHPPGGPLGHPGQEYPPP